MPFHYNNLGLKPLPHSIFEHHPTDAVLRLRRALWRKIDQPIAEEAPPLEIYRELYFAFTCSLELNAGIAGELDLGAILKLHTSALFALEANWLYLPRYAGEIPKYLDPTSQSLCMALMIHLGRGNGPGRNRVGPPPPQELNAPLYELIEHDQPKLNWGKVAITKIQTIQPCKRRLRAPWADGNAPLSIEKIQKIIRAQYHQWFKDLGRIAKLEHTLFGSHFRDLIRIDFHQRLPAGEKSWIELQMDEWPHNPAPVEQWADYHDLARPLDFQRIATLQENPELLDRIFKPEWLQRALRLEAQIQKEIELKLKPDLSYLNDIRDVVNEYKRFEKKPDAATAVQFRQRLEAISVEAKARLDQMSEESDHEKPSKAGQDLYHIYLIASWLAIYFKKRPEPDAPYYRLTTLRVLLAEFPNTPLPMLERDHLAELPERRNYATSAFNNILTDFESFRRHIERVLKKEIAEGFNLFDLYRFSPEIFTSPLLTRTQLEEILGCLLLLGENGEMAFFVVLLQLAFGIRSKSSLEITIDGLNNLTKSYPTLTVPPVKKRKGFDAQIAAEHIDPGILTELEAFRRKRLKETGGDGTQRLFAFPNGRRLNYKMYSRVLENAMRYTDNRIKKGRIHSITHVLRHYAANRWLALGLPLRLIRDYLNHRHDSTTVGAYLHAIHFKLAEMLFIDEPPPTFSLSQRGVAFLLGTSTRRLRDLDKEVLLFRAHRRKYSFSEVVTLLQHFYQQTKPVPEVVWDGW